MAVSGVTSFSLNAQELLIAALELLGVKADEEPLQQFELERGLRWMNIMLKAWEADGVMGWTETEGSLALVQSDVDYVFGSGGSFTTIPLDILDMRITRNGTDMPMTRKSKQDYQALPLKTNEGYPTQYMYDRQRDGGTLYVWPAPDSVASTVKFTYRRRIMDMLTATDNFDVPQEWYMALIYGVADQLIPIYGKSGTPRAMDVTQKATVAYNSVKSFDIDEGESSIFVVPDSYGRPR